MQGSDVTKCTTRYHCQDIWGGCAVCRCSDKGVGDAAPSARVGEGVDAGRGEEGGGGVSTGVEVGVAEGVEAIERAGIAVAREGGEGIDEGKGAGVVVGGGEVGVPAGRGRGTGVAVGVTAMAGAAIGNG